MTQSHPVWGYAYGLRFSGPFGAGLQQNGHHTWPAVTVRLARRGVAPFENHIDERTATFTLGRQDGLTIDRATQRAVITMERQLAGDELVHPFLAPIGAAFAWWDGREAIHAGAVVLNSGAIGLIGEKGQGKSTLLAWLALRHGAAVLSDDLLVVAGRTALVGPRCIDLRESAAAHLGAGTRTLRTPEVRWRVPLDPAPAEVPLTGWVFLAWGDTVGVVPIPPAELLPRLARHRSMSVAPRDPEALLELTTVPAWELTMPREWAALARAAEVLDEVSRQV